MADYTDLFRPTPRENCTLHNNMTIIDLYRHPGCYICSSITDPGHLVEVDHGDSVAIPGLDHLGHLLPLSGEGVELQDLIVVGTTVITA